MKTIRSLLLAVAIVLFLMPSLLSARQNTLTAGLGVSLDYSERSYDAVPDDPATEVDESAINEARGLDNEWFVVTPLFHFISEDVRDYFELRVAPDLRYDLEDSETEWNSDFFISANRNMTRNWQLEASDSFVIRDYYTESDVVASTVVEEPTAAATSISQLTDPGLSPNVGRSRYWRNTFRIATNHTYKEDSLFKVGFDYIVLRNDDDDDNILTGVEEYDRYALNFLNEHRFSNVWSSTIDLLFVQGDFEERDQETTQAVIDNIAPGSDIVVDQSDLSRDLNEYHALLAVENASIVHNPLTLSYNYTGTNYDETLRDDIDIHQATFLWRHDYSQHAYTRFGIGPSYGKLENRDDKWDWNGIAELNYLIEKGNINVNFGKGYMVDNFSGDAERGFVDFWNASLAGNYSLTQNLSLRGELGYLFQDREDPLVAVSRLVAAGAQVGDVTDDELRDLEQYETERYQAGLGLSYTFWRNFTGSVDYFYLRQDSERFRDDYDDHRILLTVSWAKELFRW